MISDLSLLHHQKNIKISEANSLGNNIELNNLYKLEYSQNILNLLCKDSLSKNKDDDNRISNNILIIKII